MWLKLYRCILVITQIATANILLVHIFLSLRGSSHSSIPGYGATAGGNAGRGVRGGGGGGGKDSEDLPPPLLPPSGDALPKGEFRGCVFFWRGRFNNSASIQLSCKRSALLVVLLYRRYTLLTVHLDVILRPPC